MCWSVAEKNCVFQLAENLHFKLISKCGPCVALPSSQFYFSEYTCVVANQPHHSSVKRWTPTLSSQAFTDTLIKPQAWEWPLLPMTNLHPRTEDSHSRLACLHIRTITCIKPDPRNSRPTMLLFRLPAARSTMAPTTTIITIQTQLITTKIVPKVRQRHQPTVVRQEQELIRTGTRMFGTRLLAVVQDRMLQFRFAHPLVRQTRELVVTWTLRAVQQVVVVLRLRVLGTRLTVHSLVQRLKRPLLDFTSHQITPSILGWLLQVSHNVYWYKSVCACVIKVIW